MTEKQNQKTEKKEKQKPQWPWQIGTWRQGGQGRMRFWREMVSPGARPRGGKWGPWEVGALGGTGAEMRDIWEEKRIGLLNKMQDTS